MKYKIGRKVTHVKESLLIGQYEMVWNLQIQTIIRESDWTGDGH